jgi:uncharacterized protein
MRLTSTEADAIRDAVRRHFGETARILLFGSRVDDGRRGGDIDILVEHDAGVDGVELVRKKLRAMSDIQFAIGDRKIDIATALRSDSAEEPGRREETLVVRKARESGIPL